MDTIYLVDSDIVRNIYLPNEKDFDEEKYDRTILICKGARASIIAVEGDTTVIRFYGVYIERMSDGEERKINQSVVLRFSRYDLPILTAEQIE
jgi:hypothetical protein